MKIILRISFLFSLLLSTTISKAQDSEIVYGENPQLCKEKLNIMLIYNKQKNYDAASNSWRWCFNNCPQGSKNIYIVGEKIISQKIKDNSGSPELKDKYVDTLLLVYNQRLKYFPGSASSVQTIKGKIGVALATYRPKTHYQEAYLRLDTVMNKFGKKASASIAQAYIFSAKKMVQNNKMNCAEMLTAYFKVMTVVNFNMEKKPKTYTQLKNMALSSADKCLDCQIVDSLYLADFNKNQNNITWLDAGIDLLVEKKCSKSEALVKMLEKRFETAPSAETAAILAQYFYSKGNKTKAVTFYDQAISLEKDSSKLADHFLNKAKYLNANGQSAQGLSMAKKALKNHPNKGKVYLVMGDAIVYGYNSCKDLKFGGYEIYWIAVDYYNLAASTATDNDTKSLAINNATKYAAYYPDQNSLFMQSLNDGDNYTVGCWINATTKVKHRK